ncbi:MAG: DUF1080 domain-containing protein [Balneolaceae bacterium]|nr:DUF1080 domain-containing protein [Balneolaceae bacterium]
MSYAQPHNSLTNQELAEGWELLFDGESTEHWRMYNGDTFPERGWEVRDGAMVFEPAEMDGAEGSQNIITKRKYENFHLKLEWQLGKGSNSGIFYGVLEQPDQQIYWSAPEMQIVDNDIFYGDSGTPEQTAGSLYDLVAAEPQNVNPVGQWNSVEIIVDGAHVEHWQNGEKVVETERWTPEWFEMIRNSKFECHNEFGNIRNGHIGIQDHGGLVKIRNVKIKELD